MKQVEQSKDPLLEQAFCALKRAAMTARKIAHQTNTAIVFMEDGRIVKQEHNLLDEPQSEYQTDQKQ